MKDRKENIELEIDFLGGEKLSEKEEKELNEFFAKAKALRSKSPANSKKKTKV
ncbi:hypothetical protein [Algoriphagus sp.]|uniref:hypothetical protein n=1 Tax=Algoriphagus sp. TaxID=1872435 RepID=UPI00391A49DA